jgi:hypothetical protein
VAAIWLALPVTLGVRNLPLLDRSSDTQARDRWQAVLVEEPPAEAILISNDRDEMTPLWYMQQVEAVRPDVTGLFPLIVQEPGWANVGQATEQALESGRPVFLIKPMQGLETKFDLRPAGSLVRVLGPAAGGPPEHPSNLDLGGAVRLLGSDRRSPLQPGGELELALYWQPLRDLDADYTSFVHLLDVEGRKVAQSDQRAGGVYYPTSLWRPGERLVDLHRLVLPLALGSSPHTLVIGFYRQPSLEQLGEPLRIPLP